MTACPVGDNNVLNGEWTALSTVLPTLTERYFTICLSLTHPHVHNQKTDGGGAAVRGTGNIKKRKTASQNNTVVQSPVSVIPAVKY